MCPKSRLRAITTLAVPPHLIAPIGLQYVCAATSTSQTRGIRLDTDTTARQTQPCFEVIALSAEALKRYSERRMRMGPDFEIRDVTYSRSCQSGMNPCPKLD
jgi:hypothetical protein